MRAIKFIKKFLSSRSEILNARKKHVIGSAIVTLSVCSLLQFTDAIESLENSIGRPALFSLRESLGMEPKLDPRIVVYAFNDDAVNEYGRPDILGAKSNNSTISRFPDMMSGPALPQIPYYPQYFSIQCQNSLIPLPSPA